MAFSASSSPDLAFPKVKEHTQPVERKERRSAIVAAMVANKRKAKARDGRRCRWFETHKCLGPLESHHVDPLGMGGDKAGTASETANLFTACRGIHKDFDESFHNGTIQVEALTAEGCDGPMRGLRRFTNIDTHSGEKSFEWKEVWREIAVGRVERDSRAGVRTGR